MLMQVATEHWQRRLEMAGWSLGRDYFLTRILEPTEERVVAGIPKPGAATGALFR
jgi:hypothetical protein